MIIKPIVFFTSSLWSSSYLLKLPIENEDDVDDAVFTWNKLSSEIADSHAPIKRRRVRGVPLPWMSTMQDHDYHRRKAIKSNSHFHWSEYRRLRNFVNREILYAKTSY